MSNTITKSIVLLSIIGITVILSGCVTVSGIGDLRTETKYVELLDTDSADIEISMGAGELALSGNTEKLMEATFTYNIPELKPEIGYRGEKLIVRQPTLKNLETNFPSGYRYEWDIKLNNNVSMSLNVNLGAGVSDLNLSELLLESLNINVGAGTTSIDLTGKWTHDIKALIRGGAGSITLKLPNEIGSRVTLTGGIAKIRTDGMKSISKNVFVNDAFDKSPTTLDINIFGGVGTINMVVE